MLTWNGLMMGQDFKKRKIKAMQIQGGISLFNLKIPTDTSLSPASAELRHPLKSQVYGPLAAMSLQEKGPPWQVLTGVMAPGEPGSSRGVQAPIAVG